MTRMTFALLTALAIGLLPACSSTPPKASCERHLSPINAVPPAAGVGRLAPAGAPGAGSKGSARKGEAHGR
jgi:hypothetical protein